MNQIDTLYSMADYHCMCKKTETDEKILDGRQFRT